MTPSTRALMLLLTAASFTAAHAQRSSDTTVPAPRTFVSTSRTQDLYSEWWLQLRNGAVVVADRSAIGYRGGEIEVRGTLRSLTIPASEVRAVTVMPGRGGFRNTLVGAGFLSVMTMLSPGNTPGYYLGSVRTSSYGSQSDLEFPGLSAFGALVAAGASIGAAMIANTLDEGARATLLDGTENETAWRLLLEEDSPRWHLRGAAGYVGSNAASDWKAWHARYAISPADGMSQSYYTRSVYDMTAINFGRLLRVGYSIAPRIEIGAGVQSEGVQRFYESFSFIRPGVPPQPITQELASEESCTSLYLLGQYDILPARPGYVSAHLGGGFGIASVRMTVNNFRVSSGDVTLLDESRAAFVLFGGFEYWIDRVLSVGLHVDYSATGSPTVPEQNIVDYDGRSYATIEPFKLNLSSFCVGIGVGFHL